MAKLTLTDITNIQTAIGALNRNFTTIEEAFENTLSRDGTTPNQLTADLDLNNNDLLNCGTLTASDVRIAGTNVTGILTDATAQALAAEVSASSAATSAAAALVSEINAAASEVVAANHIADTTGAHAASAITNTPSGSIAATTVQAAIDELDTEKQPLDAELTAIAGLTSAADTVPYFTGSGTAALKTLGTASGNIPLVGTSSATDALAGLVELATSAEVAAGTDTARAITPAGLAASKIVAGTAIATTSGTAHDFTGIPSWVKRITVMLSEVSTNGTSVPIIRLGDSGGFEATGYTGSVTRVADVTATSGGLMSVGFSLIPAGAATTVLVGAITLTKQDGNTWVAAGVLGRSDAAATSNIGGYKQLSDTLTQIRLTTVNGTDTFDAGAFNILYE